MILIVSKQSGGRVLLGIPWDEGWIMLSFHGPNTIVLVISSTKELSLETTLQLSGIWEKQNMHREYVFTNSELVAN